MNLVRALIGSLLIVCFSTASFAETQVVMLGTGTPVPDYQRAGPSIAVIVDGEALIFDSGAGSVRNMIEAAQRLGIEALNPINIKHVFYTHMHNDHTMDFVELAQTYWWRRSEPLTVHGAPWVARMAAGMDQMMKDDTQFRINSIQPVKHPEFASVITDVFEEPGIVYRNDSVSVEAFLVNHGDLHPSYGFKIVSSDKTVVISGDTSYSDVLVEKASGADILIHEAICTDALNQISEFWQNYHKSYHTTSEQIVSIAKASKPKQLVLYHVLFYGAPESTIIDEVMSGYSGSVVLANDLDRF